MHALFFLAFVLIACFVLYYIFDVLSEEGRHRKSSCVQAEENNEIRKTTKIGKSAGE